MNKLFKLSLKNTELINIGKAINSQINIFIQLTNSFFNKNEILRREKVPCWKAKPLDLLQDRKERKHKHIDRPFLITRQTTTHWTLQIFSFCATGSSTRHPPSFIHSVSQIWTLLNNLIFTFIDNFSSSMKSNDLCSFTRFQRSSDKINSSSTDNRRLTGHHKSITDQSISSQCKLTQRDHWSISDENISIIKCLAERSISFQQRIHFIFSTKQITSSTNAFTRNNNLNNILKSPDKQHLFNINKTHFYHRFQHRHQMKIFNANITNNIFIPHSLIDE